MSRKEGNSLPEELLSFLDGTNIDAKVGNTILMITVSETGWPHIAMLSVGELVALTDRSIGMALWQDTETGSNLKRNGRATFVSVVGETAFYFETTATYKSELIVIDTKLDLYVCVVHRVLSDVAEYAQLVTGITFSLLDRERTVTRWSRTVEAILSTQGSAIDIRE